MTKNKNILFISPSFFGVEKAIVDELQLSGNKVDWFDERPFKSAFKKAMCIAFPFAFKATANSYYKKIINSLDISYDYVLIVKGEMVSKTTISLIRKLKKILNHLPICRKLLISVNVSIMERLVLLNGFWNLNRLRVHISMMKMTQNLSRCCLNIGRILSKAHYSYDKE